MTAPSVREAHIEVLRGLEPKMADAVNFTGPEKTTGEHLFYMLSVIESSPNMPIDKIARWTGFIQGVLAERGLIDVDDERNRTRPIFTSATPPAPTPSAARERIDSAVRSACCTTFTRGYSPETVIAAVDAILALLPDAAAIRADEREKCAKIADGFSCGMCGMDGKCSAAIRAALQREGE